ncbi:MAG: hypothetical protein EOO23_06210 [Comamonadaceae bacterium]|nr:MAG: hypothetical protein EOO23_06210 [Comamonadaceae bacterium]
MTQPRAFFTSRVDTWLFAIGPLAGMSAATVALPLAMQSGSVRDAMVLLAVVAFTLILPTWLLLNTNYTLTADDQLSIQSGPFRWRIALTDVREISPSRSWVSSPALSLDRLRIRYANERTILVSPREKQSFIDALRQRCPDVLVTGF